MSWWVSINGLACLLGLGPYQAMLAAGCWLLCRRAWVWSHAAAAEVCSCTKAGLKKISASMSDLEKKSTGWIELDRKEAGPHWVDHTGSTTLAVIQSYYWLTYFPPAGCRHPQSHGAGPRHCIDC